MDFSCPQQNMRNPKEIQNIREKLKTKGFRSHSIPSVPDYQFQLHHNNRASLAKISRNELIRQDKTPQRKLVRHIILIQLRDEATNAHKLHSPTNALFIKLDKVLKFDQKSLWFSPTCLGLKPTSRNRHQCLAKFIFKCNFSQALMKAP